MRLQTPGIFRCITVERAIATAEQALKAFPNRDAPESRRLLGELVMSLEMARGALRQVAR